MRNHYLWLDAEGRHTSASWYMWVSIEAMNENTIETGLQWSSGPLFIGKIFCPSSNFRTPKRIWLFFVAASWYTFCPRSGIVLGRCSLWRETEWHVATPTSCKVSLFGLRAIRLIGVSPINVGGAFPYDSPLRPDHQYCHGSIGNWQWLLDG
jgi:hypothetical protein